MINISKDTVRSILNHSNHPNVLKVADTFNEADHSVKAQKVPKVLLQEELRIAHQLRSQLHPVRQSNKRRSAHLTCEIPDG